MRYANWALVGAFYVAGAVCGGTLLIHGRDMNGEQGGALGAAAVLFLMLPSFVQWQDRCLTGADERARAALGLVSESFNAELREMDCRHQEAMHALSVEYAAALSRAETAEDKLARMNQGPKAVRHIGPSIPRVD